METLAWVYTPEWFLVDCVLVGELCVGITPMLQIIRKVFKDPRDVTDVSLLFANQVRRSRWDLLNFFGWI